MKKWFSDGLDWKMVIFLSVVLFAIFLRVWHFHDWLFFKMDQARDAFHALHILEGGIGWIPLLGPKAGGTNLNLGPAYYYFQYVAVGIFQSANPSVMAYPDLFFSILSIPLFYLVLKRYFSRDWSMIISSAYALCFLAIEYSRFSWNPNPLPFFNLLFIFALLKVFDGNCRFPLRWTAVAAVAFSVSTQLHFLSFLTLPLITLIFLVVQGKESLKFLDWKKIAIFIAIVLVFYAPFFASDYLTHGKNTKEFFKAIHSKASDHSLMENISKDAFYFGENWAIILTGYIQSGKDNHASILTWLIFILPALVLNFYLYRREKDEKRKRFLLVTFLWFVIYFLSYIPIAYSTRPRFFLPMLFLPFIFAGYVSRYFLEFLPKEKNLGKIAAFLVFAIIIAGNLYGTELWFREIKEAQKKGVYPDRTIILKARDGVVLWHLEKVADYIAGNCPANEVYFNSISEYNRPMKYLLTLRGKQAFAFSDIKAGDPNLCTFSVKRSRAKSNKLGDEIDREYSVSKETKFGAWEVLDLKLNDDFAGKPLPSYHRGRQNSSESEDSKRTYWKDVFAPWSKNDED